MRPWCHIRVNNSTNTLPHTLLNTNRKIINTPLSRQKLKNDSAKKLVEK